MGLFDGLFNNSNEWAKREKAERKAKANRSKMKCKCYEGEDCQHYERGKCIWGSWCYKSLSDLKEDVKHYGKEFKYRKGDGCMEALEDCPHYID